MEVETPGFKKSVQSGIQLSAAAKLSIDIELTVGSVTDSVEVNATATLVQSETATVGRTIDTKQIENLTMNGRNPVYLALLKPGVIGGSIGTFDPDSVSNGGFSINGARADEYVVMVDGAVATRTRSSGSMLGAQDVDTVQEVQILTANLQRGVRTVLGRTDPLRDQERYARLPRRSGRELPQLRSRRQYLDAQSRHRPESVDSPAAVPLQPVRLRHQRPHFRAAAASTRTAASCSSSMPKSGRGAATTAPTPIRCRRQAMRDGDLSSLLNASNPFFGRARVATDPDTKQPFPGNIIPANRISPNGRALLNAYPLPTPGFQQGTSNWIGAFAHYSNLRKDTFKVRLPGQRQAPHQFARDPHSVGVQQPV